MDEVRIGIAKVACIVSPKLGWEETGSFQSAGTDSRLAAYSTCTRRKQENKRNISPPLESCQAFSMPLETSITDRVMSIAVSVTHGSEVLYVVVLCRSLPFGLSMKRFLLEVSVKAKASVRSSRCD